MLNTAKTGLVLLEIDDTGHDGYKIVSCIGHAYQPHLQLTMCFLHMRNSDMYIPLLIIIYSTATVTGVRGMYSIELYYLLCYL